MKKRTSAFALTVASALAMPIACCLADPVSDFYQGKQISIYVGSEAGGAYDAHARFARHIGKHIPGNPAVIVRNMLGSGGLTMANFIGNIGPKDGTAFGITQSTIAFEGLLNLVSVGGKAAQFEAQKLTWIGNVAPSTFLVGAWHTAKAKSFEDLATTELILGSSGLNTDGALITHALNNVLGTKIRLVPGFQSINAQMIAIERGEIDAAAFEYSTIFAMRPDWIKDGRLRFLVQCGLKRRPSLPDVPFALDQVRSPEDRQVLELIFSKYEFGRPYFAAPGIPADRAEALRAAFMEAMKDPALLAEAQKQHLDISPMSGTAVQTLVEQLYQTPRSVTERAREILGGK